MRTRLEKRLTAVLLTAAFVASASGQSVGAAVENPRSSGMGKIIVTPAVESTKQVVRVIEDPHSGAHWLLVRDGNHPGGPGLLLQNTNTGTEIDRRQAREEATSQITPHVFASLPPVIRAGDLLVVEEHSAVADVRLEAVALGSAQAGSALSVRLKIGGKVLRARALGAGLAAFVPVTEVLR